MDNVDDLLGGLASGDKNAAELSSASVLEPLKRAHDSLDDFEHLERDGKRDDPADSTPHTQPKVSSQNFLDMERDIFADSAKDMTASVVDKIGDHFADKFTDSESEGTTGESPIHRPQPPKPSTNASFPTSFLVDTPPPLVPERVSHPEEPKDIPPPLAARPFETMSHPVEPEEMPPPLAPRPSLPVKVEPPKQAPAPPPAAPIRAAPAHVIEAEVIFCQMGLDAWFDPKRLHPKVESLIYWRDPVKSGIALGAGLALLVALACCSVVSVLAYASLITLSGAVGFRIYKNVLQAVQKTNEGHPFKWLLDIDVTVPADRAQSVAAAATAHLNATINELRRLFLVEDLIDSLKFGVLLWCLTYVGAYFNGITLIILGWIALFSLPKAYEMNKAQVDANLELARAKIDEITAKVRAAVPIGKKSESEKDK